MCVCVLATLRDVIWWLKVSQGGGIQSIGIVLDCASLPPIARASAISEGSRQKGPVVGDFICGSLHVHTATPAHTAASLYVCPGHCRGMLLVSGCQGYAALNVSSLHVMHGAWTAADCSFLFAVYPASEVSYASQAFVPSGHCSKSPSGKMGQNRAKWGKMRDGA